MGGFNMLREYDLGQTIIVEGAFCDDDGAPADPSTVTLKVKQPDGVAFTYVYPAAEITKDAVGLYSSNLVLSIPGIWTYRWEGTGTVAATDEQHVKAQESVF